MRKLFSAFRRDDSGAAMAEYAILVAVIALVAVVGAQAMGVEIDARFDKIVACLKTPTAELCKA